MSLRVWSLSLQTHNSFTVMHTPVSQATVSLWQTVAKKETIQQAKRNVYSSTLGMGVNIRDGCQTMPYAFCYLGKHV